MNPIVRMAHLTKFLLLHIRGILKQPLLRGEKIERCSKGDLVAGAHNHIANGGRGVHRVLYMSDVGNSPENMMHLVKD
jgi:hypothetical protein